jgi:hypothetical protein
MTIRDSRRFRDRRTHHRSIERGVGEPEIAGISEHGLEWHLPVRLPRLFDVEPGRVEEDHLVAALGEPRRIAPGAAPDVEDPRRSSRQAAMS